MTQEASVGGTKSELVSASVRETAAFSSHLPLAKGGSETQLWGQAIRLLLVQHPHWVAVP